MNKQKKHKKAKRKKSKLLAVAREQDKEELDVTKNDELNAHDFNARHWSKPVWEIN